MTPDRTSLRTLSWRGLCAALLLALLSACSTPKPPEAPAPSASVMEEAPWSPPRKGLSNEKSRWVPVPWLELPGWSEDEGLHEAWAAWLQSCKRRDPQWRNVCAKVREASLLHSQEQRLFLETHLQAYRIEDLQGQSSGLLTAYYEPELVASRTPQPALAVPLYRPPPSLASQQPWYSRRQMDTDPKAKAALQGQAIAYLSDPVDAMILQIQGSGRLRVQEADGSERWVRLAYAGHNGHPYQSIGRWLLDQNLTRDATWPGIKAWMAKNPERVQELLWSNPRVVFFKEESLDAPNASWGPRGAQGVPLTAGRSIAVDPLSIPYGTPVWLVSQGALTLRRLVLAQDTGSAIVGAVRADFFVGSGPQAGETAGRLKQSLLMWALWPKPSTPP